MGKEEEDVVIELDDEQDGDMVDSDNFVFEKIGKSVPLKPNDSKFDAGSPPAQPLAVSDRFQVIFVAHSEGFYVANTKDVIDSAKAIKEKGSGLCIQELCIVDVPIGKVHILALSMDSSYLAAAVGGEIYLYAVESLLIKEQQAFFTCPLHDSSGVKDFRWRKKMGNTYVVLSKGGTLYRGDVDGSLKEVMDNVDAVDWSTNGKFVAVARKNTMSILSSKFRDRIHMSLLFKTLVGDPKQSIVVDSIQWVRRDSIILGCCQVAEDGEEENYFVQVISCRDGKITEDTSKPVVLSFSDVFTGIINDIVPCGSGPHLFLSYLENWELVLAANRKNTDQHIVLLGWSVDEEQKDAAVIDLSQDDRWLPTVELQENGDDNVIMGFGVDKVSLYEKVKFKQGVEEKELSPYCILLCLTLEGKLIMFYLARVVETPTSPQFVGATSDEEVDSSAVVPLRHDLPKTSSCLEVQATSAGFGAGLVEVNQKNLIGKGIAENLKGNEFLTTELSDSSPSSLGSISKKEISNSHTAPSESASKTQGPLQSSDARKGSEQSQKSGDDMQYNTHSVPKSSLFGSQSSDVEKLSVNSSHLQGITKGETLVLNPQKVGLNTDPLTGSALTGAFTFSDSSTYKDSTRSADLTKGVPRGTSSVGFPSGPYSPQPSLQPSASDQFNARSSLSPSSMEGNRNDNSDYKIGNATRVSSSHLSLSDNINNGFPTKDRSAFSVHSSGNINQSGGQRTSVGAGKFEYVPTIRSSQLSQGSSALGNSLNFKLQPTHEASKVPSPPVSLASDPALSKHLGSVNGMARELDTLLQSIEKEGGYMDTCTQKSSVLSLEQDLEKLSWKCREWRNTLEERFIEIQRLFDETVKVLSRKIYIEGFVKQSTDSQYRDLWNHQKLSPELEQKRQRLLKVNQELTNQLVQLERHFNTLELNKFDKTTVGYTASRTILEPSRHSQSLYSLYNTVNSQLRAAEQLSECLSDQMTELKVESPVKKRQSVTKELLESIGLPYDGVSFNSPDVKRGGRSPDSVKQLPFSSCSFNTKEQFRRSAMKNVEPETARRRRDSLDRSWASFEPKKTTVKRLVLREECHKVSATNSASVARKVGLSAQLKQGSLISQPSDKIEASPSLFSSTFKYETKRYHAKQEIQSNPSKQLSGSPQTSFLRANSYSGSAQSTSKFPVTQMTHNSFTSSSSAATFPSLSLSNPAQTNTQETFGFTSDRSSQPGMFPIPKSGSSEVQTNSFSKPVRQFQSETPHNQTPTSNLQAQPVISEKKSQNEISENELSNSVGVGSTQTKIMGIVNQGTTTLKSSSAASMRSNSSPSNTAFVFPSSTPSFGKVPGDSTSKTDYGNLSAPAAPSTISLTFPLPVHTSATSSSSMTPASTSPFSSSVMSFGGLIRSSTDANQPVSSKSSSSSISPSSPPPLFSSGSLSFDPPNKQLEQSSSQAASLHPKSVETKPPAGEIGLNSDLQAPPPNTEPPPSGEFDLNSEAPVKPTPAEGVSVLSASGSKSSSTAFTSGFTPESQLETPSPVQVQPQSTITPNRATGEKNEDTSVTQEDEMDEEAPETSMSDMGLGDLGSFGLGSAPTSAAPKPNPFGGAFGNNTQVKSNPFGGPFGNNTEANAGSSSPFTFRPASFSFNTSQPAQPTNPTPFSGGAFATGTSAPQPAPSGFGQLAQVGPGQQALGSVLGSFGQSRQIGTGLPGNNFANAAPGGGGAGFGAPIGGFANAATGGGFAGAASAGGGFAGAASGGGFAAAASGGGGFAGAAGGGGFAGAAGGGFAPSATGGGGFGSFGNNQGGGAFAAFGNTTPASGAPQSSLFTQIRR